MGTAWPTWQPRHQQAPSHGCERLTAPQSACSPGRPGTLRQLEHRISARHCLLQPSARVSPMANPSYAPVFWPGSGLCLLFRCLTLLLVSLPVGYPLPSEVTLRSPSSQPTILVSALGNGLNPSIPISATKGNGSRPVLHPTAPTLKSLKRSTILTLCPMFGL